jgi:hypothetical protein
MAGRVHRTEIFLDPEQHARLAAQARAEGRSVSELLQSLVRKELGGREPSRAERKKQAEAWMARVLENRQRILDRRGGKPLDLDAEGLLNEMRDERDEDIQRAAARVDP